MCFFFSKANIFPLLGKQMKRHITWLIETVLINFLHNIFSNYVEWYWFAKAFVTQAIFCRWTSDKKSLKTLRRSQWFETSTPYIFCHLLKNCKCDKGLKKAIYFSDIWYLDEYYYIEGGINGGKCNVRSENCRKI